MTSTRNKLTGSVAKRRCSKCGDIITFYKLHPCICDRCGTKVYPTKECEFKEKMKMKLRKELNNHE